MKKITFLLAGALLLTGCGSRNVSRDTIESGSEPNEDIVLTLATLTELDTDEPLYKAIQSFNEADNGCTVRLKTYASRFDADGNVHGFYEDEITQLHFEAVQDLINSDDIDIVGPDLVGVAKYEAFKNKGAFADLYTFMEDDPEVNRETLNAHVLGLNEKDGKLYSIPAYYYATTLIGKSEYVGTKRNWSLGEFIDRWNAMPEGSTVNGSVNAEGIYYDILRQNSRAFVDYDNLEVHFDAPDFRDTLEFLSSFPTNHGEKNIIDYNAPQLVRCERIESVGSALRSEMDYTTYQQTTFRVRDGSYTYVGYPSSDGQGAFLAGSGTELSIRGNIPKERQEAAWKFIRQFYTEDYQVENYRERYEGYNSITQKEEITWSEPSGFCINDAARKRTAEKTVNGDYAPVGVTLTVGGREVEQVGEELTLDEADCQYIFDYIDSIDRWEESSIDRELFNIVEPEVLAYLGGDQDIDKTIDVIQNRASIWISEQY